MIESDVEIVQKVVRAGEYCKLKSSDTIFYLLRVNWVESKIEYRRVDKYEERLYGTIDDIDFIDNDVKQAWRNIKIDKLIK